jgi:hopanoid biosynthesis associated protein HpnK
MREGGAMQIILNADDFGRSASINAAVMQAHRQGVLTSTSLMVTGDAVEEAVILARETPTLAVGLHVVVAAGRAALPREQIPHLVDYEGYFPSDPFRIGLRYFLSRAAQEELTRELQAQFDRFASTGLPLSHVDSHLHMHVHPTVLSLSLPLAVRYGARGLRMPRDDFWLALSYNRHRAGINAVQAIVFALLCRSSLRRLASYGSLVGDNQHPLAVTDRVYGLMQTGQMQEAYVLKLLHQLRVSTAELYFHPSTVPGGEPLGPNPGDLATLLSPSIRQAIQEHGLHLATYPTLRQE